MNATFGNVLIESRLTVHFACFGTPRAEATTRARTPPDRAIPRPGKIAHRCEDCEDCNSLSTTTQHEEEQR
jgi:hypothetical protein